MDYRILGRTGARVSTICLGAMMFGDAADEPESHRILDEARAAGVNFVDTSNNYAKQASETCIGRWFAQGGGRREETFLATKVYRTVAPGPNGGGNHRYTVLQRVEESLSRLQTDRIDLYYFHRPDPQTPLEEQIGVMQDLVRAGKVRYYGTSHYPSWMVVQGIGHASRLGGPPWAADQPSYSLIERDIEQEVVPMAIDTGYGLVPHSPLGGGLLTGKYKRGEPPPAGTRGAQRDQFLDRMSDDHWTLVDRLTAYAGELGCTPAQLAIAWVLARPGITASIIGPRSAAQLRDNLGAAAVVVPPAAMKDLTAASDCALRLGSG